MRTGLAIAPCTWGSATSRSIASPRHPSFALDPFRRGVDLLLGHTRTDPCPVAANLSYLAVGGAGPGPLFYFEDGRWLKLVVLSPKRGGPSQLPGWTRVNTAVTVSV